MVGREGKPEASRATGSGVTRLGHDLLALFRPGRSGADYGRLHVIDLSRGLAAVAILFWHYQHFYYRDGFSERTPEMRAVEPLHAYLEPLYSNGWMAVLFFWAISGFVFSATYMSSAIGTKTFAVHRIARLYPLHLLTLLVVATLQGLNLRLLGHWQIYDHNDLLHFFLNLFFVSGWGWERGYSFNGPIWSVSIEILIYILFWVTRKHLYRFGIAGPLALAGIFFALRLSGLPGLQLWLCGTYFFAGVSLFLLFDRLHHRLSLLRLTAAALLGLGVAAYVVNSQGVAQMLVLCAVLLGAALAERGWAARQARRLTWIGDSTYGIYLWHVPVQLVALLVLDYYVGSRAAVSQPWFLIAFIVTVVVTARFSFEYIERPARSFVRRFAERAGGRRREPRPDPSSLAEAARDLAP